jgi:hypothetical protein
VAATDCVNAALRSVGVIRTDKSERVVMSAALTLIALCERYNLSVRIVLDAADRVLRDGMDQHPVKIRAFKRLLREELPD